MSNSHSFHIPVMGTAFTADTPLKVAQYGIDSVIALADDVLLERLRKMYCDLNNRDYEEISIKEEDSRAVRITAYLNLVNELIEEKYNNFISKIKEKEEDLKQYFNLLPDTSNIKKDFQVFIEGLPSMEEINFWVKENMSLGSVDVNIMTKVDKTNYKKGVELPSEFNDAHAGLRGFANSNLESSIIFSAGMNPRLYGYISSFPDFFPNENGYIKKKIVLKVSDFRSAMIQGKFLAKKGLWVSEYRVESGLNCGGHAFATDGFLMGPILAEFRDKKQELIDSTYEVCQQALESNDKIVPKETLKIKITAQGGVGTSEEHDFLINHYNLDSVGWGTPFLLVPTVTTVDDDTIEQLKNAKEKDLYLSNVSPLGVPFNNLRGSSKEIEKMENAQKGKAGSSCPRKFLAMNYEYNKQGMCTASRKFQSIKFDEIKDEKELTENEKYDKIIEKTCLCVGLSATSMIKNNIATKDSMGVSICPGPNMAYFSKTLSLSEMVHHIYGKINVISSDDRPNMFVKEFQLYIDFLKNKIRDVKDDFNKKQDKYLSKFMLNMNEGIEYYYNLFQDNNSVISDLDNEKLKLNILNSDIEKLKETLVINS
ncbi:MAG: hypothetical protein HN427_04900 [Flavobacteriales bacterium]|jgi:hypothetical protein|nr:hypothetical protein [Flavobacteriales bacterium]MBT7481471.1 hypothetical protein [Flavobacteriales bacterium]